MEFLEKIIEGEFMQSICVQSDCILIRKNRKIETAIPKSDIFRIQFVPAKLFSNGFLSFKTKNNDKDIDYKTAKKDNYSISFINTQSNGFTALNSYLNKELFSIPLTIDAIKAEQRIENIGNSHLSKRERISENKKNGIACCPKCGSTSISANQKGFGAGKAVIGAWVAGPIGIAAGGIGSKKVIATCLNCGHKWKV